MLTVRARDVIGAVLIAAKVFNLNVSETLARLIDGGDVVVDAGANIGYMTSIRSRP